MYPEIYAAVVLLLYYAVLRTFEALDKRKSRGNGHENRWKELGDTILGVQTAVFHRLEEDSARMKAVQDDLHFQLKDSKHDYEHCRKLMDELERKAVAIGEAVEEKAKEEARSAKREVNSLRTILNNFKKDVIMPAAAPQEESLVSFVKDMIKARTAANSLRQALPPGPAAPAPEGAPPALPDPAAMASIAKQFGFDVTSEEIQTLMEAQHATATQEPNQEASGRPEGGVGGVPPEARPEGNEEESQ